MDEGDMPCKHGKQPSRQVKATGKTYHEGGTYKKSFIIKGAREKGRERGREEREKRHRGVYLVETGDEERRGGDGEKFFLLKGEFT